MNQRGISPVTFLGAPRADEIAVAARYAFLGIPYGVPYAAVDPSSAPHAAAANAVRAASQVYLDALDHYDFDLGGAPFPDGVAGVLADCGDVAGDPCDARAGAARATATVARIAAAGAVPLVVGGDHSIPPLVVRGLPSEEPLDVLQVDAHLDYRNDVDGVPDGFSSPIRRLRDLPWVRRVVQVGLRDIGSARQAEVDAAAAAGNVLVTAAEVHTRGVDWIVELFEPGARVYVTIDVDGLDPSCAPGTLWPAPGGLWHWQTARLVHQIVTRCRLAGMDVCEFVPGRDLQGHTALLITRLVMLAAAADARRAGLPPLRR
ncbi:MAG: arginase family protein [Thermoleophilia bacterium]